jgi:hypothetical protein
MTRFDELDRSMHQFVELISGSGFKRGTKSQNLDRGEFELETFDRMVLAIIWSIFRALEIVPTPTTTSRAGSKGPLGT